MAIPYLVSIDLNKNELLNVRAQNLATDPAAPGVGQYWYNTTDKKFRFFDGTEIKSFVTEVELTAALTGYQAKITASGLLKGDGNGGVTAAEAGVDYQAPITVDAEPTPGSTNPVQSGGVYSALEGKQDDIMVSGILKGDGAGGVSAAQAGTDYQAPIVLDADKVMITDGDGKPAASTVTATELSYLSGVTSPIQAQLDNIPKYNYLEGLAISVADGADQGTINTAALAAINGAYAAPSKWDAVVVRVVFDPSDTVKDGLYYYNGSEWVFLYYVSTGINVANGATAGIVESSDDISFANGKGTVNAATKLRTAVTIGVSGVTGEAQSFDGSQNIVIPITEVPIGLLTGVLPVSKGGTGVDTLAAGEVLIGNGANPVGTKAIDTTVTDNSENLVTSGAVAAALGKAGNVNKYTEQNGALTPAGGVATWTVEHGLGTQAVIASVAYAASPFTQVMVDVENTSTSSITIKINTTETIAAGTFTVTVLG